MRTQGLLAIACLVSTTIMPGQSIHNGLGRRNIRLSPRDLPVTRPRSHDYFRLLPRYRRRPPRHPLLEICVQSLSRRRRIAPLIMLRPPSAPLPQRSRHEGSISIPQVIQNRRNPVHPAIPSRLASGKPEKTLVHSELKYWHRNLLPRWVSRPSTITNGAQIRPPSSFLSRPRSMFEVFLLLLPRPRHQLSASVRPFWVLRQCWVLRPPQQQCPPRNQQRRPEPPQQSPPTTDLFMRPAHRLGARRRPIPRCRRSRHPPPRLPRPPQATLRNETRNVKRIRQERFHHLFCRRWRVWRTNQHPWHRHQLPRQLRRSSGHCCRPSSFPHSLTLSNAVHPTNHSHSRSPAPYRTLHKRLIHRQNAVLR